MSKRKKSQTSDTSGTSGEGVRSSKPQKKPRLGDSYGAPQSPKLGCLPAPKESEDKLEPAPHTEHSGDPQSPSAPGEDTEVPSRLLGQTETDALPFPVSQNSVGKFVPQFAKSRKTSARKAETREDNLGSGAFNLEVPQASSAGQMESQQAPLGPATLNEGGPVEGVQTANAHPKQPSQFSPEPVQASGVSLLMTSINSFQSGQMTPSASEGASQKLPSEPGTSALEGGLGSLAPCFLAEQQEDSSRPGTDGAHKEPLLSSESEGKKPNGGAPQEEGEGFLCAPGPIPSPAPRQGLSPVSRDPESGSAAQGCPDQEQTSSKPVIIVCADENTGSTATPPGALEVAKLDGQAPNDGGRSGALPSSSEALGEAGPDQIACGSSDPTAASSALVLENQEPTVGAGDPSLLPLEVDPGADVMPSPGEKRLGDACALPSLAEPVDGRADEQGSKGQLDPKPPGYSLSLGITSPPEDREVVNVPPQGRWIRTALDPAEQTVWGCSSPMELDFLANSQIQGALDTPDFEALPEQPSPVGSRSVPCWPGTSPPADGAPISTTQPRTCDSRNKGNKAAEARELEDATATVCGLVMELSNLNRLIMSTHRDLEACKRLSYRQGKLAGKIPAPYASKGAGNHPRGEQSWRDK